MRMKCKAAAPSCEVDLPLSRCRMFQLRPPSVRPVVSGPGPDVNTAPAFVLARPPQETSPVWPLCIPKHAYPMAIDECRPFQSRANISQGPTCSGKTSEGGFMFWIWFGGSRLRGVRGSDLQYMRSCPVPKVCRWRHFVILRPWLWGYGWTTPLPNAHPLAEFIHLLCTKTCEKDHQQVVWYLYELIHYG